jgi:hypothetical protein
MTYQVLAVVVGSLMALSAFAMPPEDANYAPSVSVRAESGMSAIRG